MATFPHLTVDQFVAEVVVLLQRSPAQTTLAGASGDGGGCGSGVGWEPPTTGWIDCVFVDRRWRPGWAERTPDALLDALMRRLRAQRAQHDLHHEVGAIKAKKKAEAAEAAAAEATETATATVAPSLLEAGKRRTDNNDSSHGAGASGSTAARGSGRSRGGVTSQQKARAEALQVRIPLSPPFMHAPRVASPALTLAAWRRRCACVLLLCWLHGFPAGY